jgi:hypothetical protein
MPGGHVRQGTSRDGGAVLCVPMASLSVERVCCDCNGQRGVGVWIAGEAVPPFSELSNDSRGEAKIDLVSRVAFEQDAVEIGSVKLIRINTGVEVVHLSQPNR